MMNLLKRTQQLHQRVTGLAAARGRYDEGKELDDFRVEKLAPRLERLTKVQAIREAFEACAIRHPVELVPEALPAKVGKLRSSFVRSPTRTTLVASSGWPALQSIVDNGIGAAEQALREAWGAFCSGKLPQETLASLRQDPVVSLHLENGPLLQEAEKILQQMAKASSALPRTTTQVDEFLALAAKVQDLLGRLNRKPPAKEQTPPDVQRFLQTLHRDGSAGLELLTDEVLEWLKAGDRLAQFEVRRKAS